MIAKAIIKDGGLLIPGIGRKIKTKRDELTIQFNILEISPCEKDPFIQAAGILRNQKVDPLEYQKVLRDEWNR